MASFFSDNDDLRFYFEHGVDWAALAEVSEHGFASADGHKSAEEAITFYREVAATMGELAATHVAPVAAQIDREGAHLEGGEAVMGPSMSALFARFRDAELYGLCLPRELGGLNAPLLLYFLSGEMIARADVSTMAHFSFHGGMAMAMLAYSIHEGSTSFDAESAKIEKTRFADEIAEIIRGDAWGSMDITEPNAGSDMAALRAHGEQDPQGRWFVTGQKIFITSGHGKYHFVIARTERAGDPTDPFAGLGGLSMFMVRAYEDLPDGTRKRFVTIDRVEEKLGHHGSVTASLSFERAPAELIGKRGEGFKYMLVLMNNARVGVGFESIGLAEAAYRMAVEYAEGRKSMGKAIIRHEMIADYLDEMKTDIQGLRSLAVVSGFHEEMARKLELASKAPKAISDTDKKRAADKLDRHRRRARRFTPLLKYLAAEKAVEIARRNLQIHGGVGYTQDYGAERLLRDAVVMPIYEGTSQIQSLMAMKDTLLGIFKRPQAFISRLAEARWRGATARDPLERRLGRVQTLSLSAQQFLLTRTAATKAKSVTELPLTQWREAMTKDWDPKRDFALAMLHAERLTRLLADEAIAELLFEQAKKHPERREICERWLDRAEVRDRALYDEITTTGRRILESLEPQAASDARAVPEAAE